MDSSIARMMRVTVGRIAGQVKLMLGLPAGRLIQLVSTDLFE